MTPSVSDILPQFREVVCVCVVCVFVGVCYRVPKAWQYEGFTNIYVINPSTKELYDCFLAWKYIFIYCYYKMIRLFQLLDCGHWIRLSKYMTWEFWASFSDYACYLVWFCISSLLIHLGKSGPSASLQLIVLLLLSFSLECTSGVWVFSCVRDIHSSCHIWAL